jgi:GNAT superfamily N-acetyltransferase
MTVTFWLRTTDYGPRTICMCDDWMPLVELPLTIAEFRQLPRNSAYKYEYLDNRAYLSPRPKHYHAMLDLRPITVSEPVDVAPLKSDDLMDFTHLFAGAFRYIQPYGCLDDAGRLEAAKHAMERVRSGGDGPLIERASFVALENAKPVGVMLVTILPDSDPCDFDGFEWHGPPPPDWLERKLGRPHLTWVFVSPLSRGHGIATALLAASVRELLALGYTQMLSTFMLGNDSSTLWHWRNGFRLLSHPGSYRLMKERWKRSLPSPGT